MVRRSLLPLLVDFVDAGSDVSCFNCVCTRHGRVENQIKLSESIAILGKSSLPNFEVLFLVLLLPVHFFPFHLVALEVV